MTSPINLSPQTRLVSPSGGFQHGAIIRGMGAPRQTKQPEAEDIAEAVFRKLQNAGAARPEAL